MKRMMNITDYPSDIGRFRDGGEAYAFAAGYGCDGLELLQCEGGNKEFFPAEAVVGVHLRYFSSWMDLWKGNLEALAEEYGSLECTAEIFGGLDRESLIQFFSENLKSAAKKNPLYVVFHVSEVRMKEVYTNAFAYTDEEVVDAAAELINCILDGQDYEFEFLMENLWWPGLTLTRPEITKRLLDKVHYPKKGIMLDTGHLMHCNLDLKTEEEAIDYILEMVERHGDLKKYIRGIHLNQSITGEYVKELLAHPEKIPKEQSVLYSDCYGKIFNIDRHMAFTTPKVRKLIEAVRPEYLTHEFLSGSLEEYEEKISAQCRALGIK